MAATVVLSVLALLGLAIHAVALRVHTAQKQASAAALGEDGIFDTFNCCCREAEPKTCDYLATKSKGRRNLCCHATHKLICPSGFSTRKDSCFGRDVPLVDRLRAYKYVQVLNPDTFLPAEQGESVNSLGAGFSGVVYLARNRSTGQLLAVKMARNSQVKRRLAEECDRVQKVHARLDDQSSNYSRIIECSGQEKDYKPPFVALEYAGKSAVNALAAAKDHMEALRLLKQVFLGLRALDTATPPTIHHDLKWDNVALADDGCLKIIDLDSATKGLDEKRFTRGKAFTEAYAPPELRPRGPYFECGVREGGNNCPLAYSYDAYSAGIMAASVLCGAPEFYAMKIAQDREAYKSIVQMSAAAGYRGHTAFYDAGLILAATGEVKSWSMADQARMLRNWSTAALESVPSMEGSWKQLSLDFYKAMDSKLRFCESAFKSSASSESDFSLLDWLRSKQPQHRPRPQEVLESALFRDIQTGCSRDA